MDYQDSNLDKQNQNLLCYHYTIVHWRTINSFFCFLAACAAALSVLYAGYTTHIIGYYSILSPKAQTLQRLFAQNSRFSQNVCPLGRPLCYTCIQKGPRLTAEGFCTPYRKLFLWQHRIIPALRLKHRSGGCGTASALPKCSIRHPVLSALLA